MFFIINRVTTDKNGCVFIILAWTNIHRVIARNNPETLLMVALTRSKMNLFLTYSGFLHSLVKKFEATCQTIPLNKASNEKASDINFDF